MGDIIEEFRVRTSKKGKGTLLRLYFDTGSPHTFIAAAAAHRLGRVLDLGQSLSFAGLGNGRFTARSAVHLEVRLLEFWCRHFAYVLLDELDDDYDMLVGHDLMQNYGIRCDSRRHRVILNRGALRRAQKVL